jgi:hypothetical protein
MGLSPCTPNLAFQFPRDPAALRLNLFPLASTEPASDPPSLTVAPLTTHWPVPPEACGDGDGGGAGDGEDAAPGEDAGVAADDEDEGAGAASEAANALAATKATVAAVKPMARKAHDLILGSNGRRREARG